VCVCVVCVCCCVVVFGARRPQSEVRTEDVTPHQQGSKREAKFKFEGKQLCKSIKFSLN
jgi:hypothetical protein